MEKHCKTCDTPLPDTAKFCPRCGAPAQGDTCAQCGAEFAPGDSFCAGCGAPRQAFSPQTPPPPPRPPAGAGGPPTSPKLPAPPKRKAAVLIAVIAAVLALAMLGIFVIGPNIPRWLDGGMQAALQPGETPGPAVATFKDPETVVYSENFGYFPVNQMAVVFYDDVNRKEAAKILKQIGGTVVGELDIINLYQLETDFTTEAELNVAMEAARALDGVELVFPNAEIVADVTVEGTPCSPLNDPVFEDPQNAREYQMIGLDNAWRILKASGVDLGKVKMGALDTALYTGADDAGEFMGNSRVKGPTTDQPNTNRRGQIIDGGLSHGRMVSNVMSGITDLLDDDVEIDVTNLFDGQPDYTETQEDANDITQGVDGGTAYAIKALVYLKQQVDNNATVINCSFNPKVLSDDSEWISKAYTKFFEYMQKKKPGVVFVCSAGNAASADKSRGGSNGKNNWPGGLPLPNVITVGALNDDGSRADFSNFEAEGGEVTLSAPGVEMVVGLDKDGKPVKSNGTSFAAPQVAAAVALLQAVNPKLNADEIKDLLTRSAAPYVPADVKPGEVSAGDQSLLIPEGMGAGVLRVDEAVLQAINDMREKQDLPPYGLEQLVEMGTVRLTATGGPKEYTVTASIAKARTGSADVKIEVTGTHSMTGSTTQNVSAGGSATWSLTLDKDPVFVRVVRLDCNTCAYFTLEPPKVPTLAEMAGLYADGTYTLTKIFISDALIAEAEGAASEAGEEGCDMDMINQLRANEGKTDSMPFTISAYSETEGQLGGAGEDADSLPFSYSPDSGAMTFAWEKDKQRMAGALYAVISEETTVVISGTLRMTVTEVSEDDFYINMTITGTKPLSEGP